MVTKRNGSWFIYFYPFKGGKKIGLKLPNVKGKKEAESVEAAILQACRNSNFAMLDSVSREACIRMFDNQKWQLPVELGGDRMPKEELTLWRAMELCLKYPGVKDSANRGRHEQAFLHVVEKWGKDFPVKSIWVPEIKEYQIHRLNKGAAASTINKERAALSKMFQCLIELRHVDMNPIRLVKPLSEKSAKRQVYISSQDFQKILACLADWFQPIAQTAYYTGMRRGEILGLTWKRVNLKARMIYLGPDDVKEKDWKRVPIHQDLLPILEGLRRRQVIGLDRLFMHNGSTVTHKDQVRWAWDRNVAKVEGLDPLPHFHDLRHTWKVNARRSGVHPEIEQAIMGHASRAKGVHEGYGRISNDELIAAIDQVTFDHGDTEIFVSQKPKKEKSRQVQSAGSKNSNWIVTGDKKTGVKRS
jgi:integrase